jgi:hypothetical protein
MLIKIIYFWIFIFLSFNVLAFTNLNADYCVNGGNCEISVLHVTNLTVNNSVYINVTSYNVTGDINISGDINIFGCVNFPDGSSMCSNNVTSYYPLTGSNTLCLSGSCITSWANVNISGGGSGGGHVGFPPYLFNDSAYMYFNESKLNSTISNIAIDTNLSAGGRIDGDLYIDGKLNVTGCATYTIADGYVTLCGSLSTFYNTTGGYVCTGHCI